ncbi:MAG TPA: ATP-binding protein [Candidatus Krumholzibacteria bacterium]|nr:ATP-binding protein [Candidatus Krumholzibacteria bacterium]
MRAVPRTLAFRLVFALTVFMAVMRVVFGFVEDRRLEQLVLDQTITGADELSRSVASATWNAMLADDREAAYRIMSAIGEEHGVERICLVNERGEVTFSTEARGGVAPHDSLCCGCAGEADVGDLERPVRRSRVFEDPGRGRVLQVVTPILNEPSCYEAACHAHQPTDQVLGQLAIDLDLDEAGTELAAIRRDALARTLVEILLMGLIIVVITRWMIGVPLQKLLVATRAGSRMELDQPVEVRGQGELRVLADSFDAMRARLRDALRELREFNEGLEQTIEERSRELGAAQQRLIQSDRMASLGQLAASVAHEINNPVSGVLNYSMVVKRMLENEEDIPENLPRVRRFLDTMTRETERVGRIVKDLLAFSRRAKPTSDAFDLREVIDRVMGLLEHRLELGKVRSVVDVAEGLPRVSGDASQIEQILLNLVMNAAEAQPGAGTITVSARPEDDTFIVLEVSDEGTGIEPSHLERVFDPFFTTKDEGRGVGLGLSVVYGIVEAHGGTIEVESEVGRGTTFRVRLPRNGPPGGRRHDEALAAPGAGP